MDMGEGLNLKSVLKAGVKKFSPKDDYHKAKLYNRDGVLILSTDFDLINSGDILYIACRGEDFNYCAILDDYELGRTLGVGGFGKVIHGRHRETRAEVAVKFTDCGD
mgnify:CR=1 FL=1